MTFKIMNILFGGKGRFFFTKLKLQAFFSLQRTSVKPMSLLWSKTVFLKLHKVIIFTDFPPRLVLLIVTMSVCVSVFGFV